MVYSYVMDVNINTRHNGMCPQCMYLDQCKIHAALSNTLHSTPDPHHSGMELVIYDCPNFSNK